MSRDYTRISKTKPFPDPRNEREDLINQCWSIGVSVYGANDPNLIEIGQLRDIVQAQFEKVAAEPEFSKGNMTEQGREGFREYLRWRDRRKLGDLHYSMPGIPGQGV